LYEEVGFLEIAQRSLEADLRLRVCLVRLSLHLEERKVKLVNIVPRRREGLNHGRAISWRAPGEDIRSG
jgi:hypothetical protein